MCVCLKLLFYMTLRGKQYIRIRHSAQALRLIRIYCLPLYLINNNDQTPDLILSHSNSHSDLED